METAPAVSIPRMNAPAFAPEPQAGPPISRRSLLGGIAIGIPASAVFLYFAARGLDPSTVVDVIRKARLIDASLAVTAMSAVYCLQATRWQRIAASAGMPVPRRAALRMVISSVALNNVVPGRPGEFVRAYWLSRESGSPGARALSTVIVDRAADVLTLMVALFASYPFLPHPFWLQRLVEASIPLGLVILAMITVSHLHVLRRKRGAGRVPGWVRSRWIGQQLSRMVRTIASTVNRRDLVVLALLSASAWGSFAAGAWLVARSLDIGVSLPQLLFVSAVVNLGVAIPSSPGFIGAYQWLCVASLGLFGVERPSAFAFSILLEAVWFVPTTLVGLVLLIRHAGRWRDRRRLDRAGEVPNTQLVKL
jgi:glycosyltransferase 2 family protein